MVFGGPATSSGLAAGGPVAGGAWDRAGHRAAGRLEFEQRMEVRRLAEADEEALQGLRRGWCFGSTEFRRRILEELEPVPGDNPGGGLRQETAINKAALAPPPGCERDLGIGSQGCRSFQSLNPWLSSGTPPAFCVLRGKFAATIRGGEKVVRIRGLEPLRLSALPPQSSVSANSTICAQWGSYFAPEPAGIKPFQRPISQFHPCQRLGCDWLNSLL